MEIKERKGILKNFSYSVLANAINMFVSIILVLIVPKVLGVKEYSYWQLYAFYASYLGFFHFGWADGIYLRFGGKRYEELDKEYFNSQFWLLTILETIISCIIIIFALKYSLDVNKKTVFIMLGVCCFLWLPRTLLQYLLQTTNRISDYAKNYMMEKLVYAVLVVLMLFCGVERFEMLLCCDLIAKAWTLVLLIRECKDIVLRPIRHCSSGIKEAWININVGIKLLFANIASLLITGIVRFAIENHWSIETFGRVSLTMTVSNMIMIFISAVSIVMYPLLKNTPNERLPLIYASMRSLLMIPVLGMLLLYYPAKVILSAWLPRYAESLRFMALLFPMCVFESKTSMLINTYLKALRKEKLILKINMITVILTVFTAGILVYGLRSLTLSVASLGFLLAFRSILGELVLSRMLKLNVIRDIMWESILAIVFVVCSWNIQTWLCTMIYGTVYITYLFAHKNDLEFICKKVKSTLFIGRKE